MIDWSIGSYERTAAELDGVSERVVGLAAAGPGEQVLDIACGTGNAALKAAAGGASVIGVDLAERLVRVAEQRARAAGLTDTRFVTGDAQQLPIDDASVDVALSVFGLIFAPDQPRAAAELVRVLKPGGRAVVTGWVRKGALADVGAATARALAAAAPAPPEGRAPAPTSIPVDWGDPATGTALFAPHRVSLTFADGAVPFRSASPDEWVREQAEHHPLWLGAREALGAERFLDLERQLVDILHAANEDSQALLVTSRYLVTSVTLEH